VTSTWGELLERQAGLHRRRVTHTGAWQAPLEPLVGRLSARLARNRYERIEALPGRTGAEPADDAGHAGNAGRVPVPPAVLARLADMTGPGATGVKVHRAGTGQLAPATTAQTVGTDIYVRRLADPGSAEEFGLLVHESVHAAAAARPGAGWRRSSPQAVAEEEDHALRLERLVRAGAVSSPLPSAGLIPAPVPASAAVLPPVPASGPARAEPGHAPSLTPAARPMKAAEDRDLTITPAVRAAVPDPAELRRQVRQDLIAQIRTEFERGA
jgi:hypothetical protein